MENENIYVDLLLTNSIQSVANNRVAVDFFLNQSQPILRDTTDYKLSVIRFSLNTETLPIFIPQMSDDDTTIYSMTMEYNGNFYQQYMNFIPQNSNPVEADEKYYIYSYQYVIYLFNKMINECLVGLNDISATPTIVPPKMFFEVDSQLCGMRLDSSFYGFNEANKINIYMNTQLYALLSTLPASIIHLSDGKDFQINNLISDDLDLLTQEYKTIELWNPVSSIVFTSNMLPTYQSVTAPIQVYIDGDTYCLTGINLIRY